MKQLSFALLFTAVSLVSAAQTHKVTVFCNVAVSGRINYNKLDKLLPDSLQSLLIDPGKEYDLKNGDDILLWMSLNGWKLVGVESVVNGGTGGGGMITTSLFYEMSKEISLDDAAYALFTEALKNVEKKG